MPRCAGCSSESWNVSLRAEPGLRIPNMFEAALDGSFKGLYVQGEDLAQSDPNTQHVTAALSALECLVVQDLFINETAKYAHVFLPGSSFLEKDGTFTNAERRISPVRKVMDPPAGLQDWEITQQLANALGYPMNYSHPREIMAEIAALTPTFTGVTYDKLDRLGSLQWPCNDRAPEGTPTMHVGEFVRGKGRFYVTEYVPTDERTTARYPLILTTGRVLTQYNVGAQTRRTENVVWHDEDRLEIHPDDAETRGIADGDWVGVASRAGETVLRATVTARVHSGRRLHDLPLPGIRRQRHHDRQLRLGDELPGVQGDCGRGRQGRPAVGMAAPLPRVRSAPAQAQAERRCRPRLRRCRPPARRCACTAGAMDATRPRTTSSQRSSRYSSPTTGSRTSCCSPRPPTSRTWVSASR